MREIRNLQFYFAKKAASVYLDESYSEQEPEEI